MSVWVARLGLSWFQPSFILRSSRNPYYPLRPSSVSRYIQNAFLWTARLEPPFIRILALVCKKTVLFIKLPLFFFLQLLFYLPTLHCHLILSFLFCMNISFSLVSFPPAFLKRRSYFFDFFHLNFLTHSLSLTLSLSPSLLTAVLTLFLLLVVLNTFVRPYLIY